MSASSSTQEAMKTSKACKVVLIVVVVVGIALIAIGAGLLPYFNNQMRTKVNENVQLVNNSEAYKAWKSPPATIYLDFYFLEVLNPDDIVDKSSRPHVVERGPYVYRELKNKIDIEFLNESRQLRYKEAKWYTFDPEMSNGTEDDNITCLNFAVVALATKIQYKGEFLNKFVRAILNGVNTKLFESHTVHEWLFGYTPPFITSLRKKLPWFFQFLIPNVTVGFYTGPTANGTDNGEYDIVTGVSDIQDLGNILTWNGAKNVSFWTTPECNMINGTDGSLWHPFIKKTDVLYIFNSDLCRSVYIEYEGEGTVSSSHIPVLKFGPTQLVMANETVNPDNAGFCTPRGNCMGAGVLNVSTCRDGVPIVMSQPHFIEADEKYKSAIDGLFPEDLSRKTYIDIEPITGIVINASKKLQINFHVAKLQAFAPTLQLAQEYVFPVIWANEHAVISDEDAVHFKKQVLDPIFTASLLLYLVIAAGGLLILIVVVFLVVHALVRLCRRSRDGDGKGGEGEGAGPLGDEDDDPLIRDA